MLWPRIAEGPLTANAAKAFWRARKDLCLEVRAIPGLQPKKEGLAQAVGGRRSTHIWIKGPPGPAEHLLSILHIWREVLQGHRMELFNHVQACMYAHVHSTWLT